MKPWLAWLALGLLPLAAMGQEPLPRDPANLSVRNEVQLAIDKANGWLAKEQHADGSWSDPDRPALTALPLLAILGNPQRPDRPREALDTVRRALEAIRRHAHPDGIIAGKDEPILNTAISLAALQRANLPEDDARVAAARAYLLAQQKPDGGFGDLISTAWVVDTLERASALPAAAAEGARRYARQVTAPDAIAAAHLILAITDPSAPKAHPLISENPKQLYFTVRALHSLRPKQAPLAELALQLINTQTSAGTWAEKANPAADPVEVTAYGVLTLELLYGML